MEELMADETDQGQGQLNLPLAAGEDPAADGDNFTDQTPQSHNADQTE